MAEQGTSPPARRHRDERQTSDAVSEGPTPSFIYVAVVAWYANTDGHTDFIGPCATIAELDDAVARFEQQWPEWDDSWSVRFPSQASGGHSYPSYDRYRLDPSATAGNQPMAQRRERLTSGFRILPGEQPPSVATTSEDDTDSATA